jgi:hypothetical protein
MNITPLPIEKRKGRSGRHIITVTAPAKVFYNGLKTGNGTMMITGLGNPQQEEFCIEHEKLLAFQWKTPPKAPLLAEELPEIRRLILEGKYQEAAEYADMKAAQNGCSCNFNTTSHHPALFLKIERETSQAKDYIQTLSLETSLASTSWNDENGEFSQEYFCSRTDHIGAIRMQGPKGKLNLKLSANFPVTPYVREEYEPNDVPGGRYGLFDGTPEFPNVTIHYEPDAILVDGIYRYDHGSYALAVKLLTEGGSTMVNSDGITISNSHKVTLFFQCEKLSCEESSIHSTNLLKQMGAMDLDFDALLERHVSYHKPIFQRLSVDLGGAEEDYLLSTVELKKKQFLSQEILPAYMEAMVDMGRFFLLNESGEFPPIYGHVNVNVNHQISGGNIGNLPEMMESFFRWIENQLKDARENAKRILGTRGFFIAGHPDEEMGKLNHFGQYWPHHFWISSSGWCLQPFLEHYYCTGDRNFLRDRLLPLYKELAELYEDFLTVEDKNGKLMFIPSYSPENFPQNIKVMSVINATMDISVCREVLQVLLSLGKEENIGTTDDYLRWQSLLDKLPPYLIDQHGELKEWAWEDYEERYDHRHASHLYGAYPGDEFQPDLNPELYEAAFIANRMRALGNESCHGIMHRAQAAARLKDSWLVQKILRFTLESGYVNDNFLTAHNPYKKHYFPDGQGSLPTVLLESLVYSRPGIIELLPALPAGSFQKGCLKGMSARSFAGINRFRWNLDKKEMELEFTSLKDQDISIRYKNGWKKSLLIEKQSNFSNEKEINISVKANETIKLLFEL